MAADCRPFFAAPAPLVLRRRRLGPHLSSAPKSSRYPLAAMASRIPQRYRFDQNRADPRPSVAVMPFATMSGGGEQSYFADGLTEDVTTALARNSELQVIARDSTYAVRGQNAMYETWARSWAFPTWSKAVPGGRVTGSVSRPS